MIVAGGCYREICETPYWDALYGSGGRAAKALARLDPAITLCTYFPSDQSSSLYHLEAAGITVRAQDSQGAIAFAYFHPLSDPVIAPSLTSIAKEKSIRVAGSSVLRFGFVEGDAIVDAKRAVYDPQSKDAPSFQANGSKSEQLALVLNEGELRTLGQAHGLGDAAASALAAEKAALVLVKCGARGAWLYRLHTEPVWIPAYRSEKVFKIGSGDVFSAVFAYYWTVESRDAVEAAHLASRSVSQYVATRELPVGSPSSELEATSQIRHPVYLIGSKTTLGDRWLCDEASWHLQLLGANARPPTDGIRPPGPPGPGTALILGNTFADDGAGAVHQAIRYGLKPVVLLEGAGKARIAAVGTRWTDDFTTALYWTMWEN